MISSWYALGAGAGESGGGGGVAGGGDLAGLAWLVWATAISSRRLVTAAGGQCAGGDQSGGHTLQALAEGGEPGTVGRGGLTGSCS